MIKPKIRSFDWVDRKRTMLKKIMPGDYFCFELPGLIGFGCGRILAKVSLGHSAAFFSGVLAQPFFSTDWVGEVSFFDIVDSYSLFDRKKEGDWRIVAGSDISEESFDFCSAWFGYGTLGDRQKVNLAGKKLPCSEEEYRLLPAYRPAGNKVILKRMGFDS